MDLITELSATDRVTLEEGQLGVVEFYLPTCKACNNFTPAYEQLAQENQDIRFYRMDVTSSEGKSPSQIWNVRAVPTVGIFTENISPDNELARMLGNKPQEAVKALLEKYKPS
ncbi:thioredoxin family protein [Neorickettsia findlayensis]|uniref:Thioredoxin n=1 Tax=Neorickettsia findlayensis TaxID=2686014 RepID=A0A6P1G970_9RICK|nr:thioredoxin family protein [Neorickettsia findlayensis]QHD65017.1 thioredoxin [Neorickettsia findlayensis]